MKTAIDIQEENTVLKAELSLKNNLIDEKNKVIEQKDKTLEQKNHYILQLEEAIKQQRQKAFSASSEKASADQLGLFNEAENSDAESCEVATPEDTVSVASHTRQKKPRVSIPDDLPREDIIHDLSESEKICPHDGTELQVIGSEDHEQLDIIPAQVNVIRHKR